MDILKKYDIDVVTHVMCGLPGEEREQFFKENNKNNFFKSIYIENGMYIPKSIYETVKLINTLNIQGIKIHSTYVVKNTKLCELYNSGKYMPLELDEYLYDLIYIITHLKKEIVVHRICADAPKDILVAPDWNLHKKWVLNKFEKIMRDNNLQQGMFEI